MKIQVTQADIKRGVKCQCYSCPVAFAMKRKFKKDVSVTYETFYIDGSNKRYALPAEAILFIQKFDTGETVTPFNFHIEEFPI